MKTLFLLIIFFVPLLAQSLPPEDSVIQAVGLSRVYPVSNTGSMRPTFDERYLILVQSRPFRSLQEGDVIVFWRPNPLNPEMSLVCHRIWRRSSGGSLLITRGDANAALDPGYVTEDQYAGLVVGWVRKD